jgi:hypothetical protein
MGKRTNPMEKKMSRSMRCVLTLPFAFASVAAASSLIGCATIDSPDEKIDETNQAETAQAPDKTSEPAHQAGTAADLSSDETHVVMAADETGEKTDVAAAGSVSGCTIYASITKGDKNGFGEIACPYYADSLEVEACLEQLVTGGWETIDWTCAVYSSSSDHTFLWTTTYAVPYWTAGRWYQTQVWARVNGGAWGYTTSTGIQG